MRVDLVLERADGTVEGPWSALNEGVVEKRSQGHTVHLAVDFHGNPARPDLHPVGYDPVDGTWKDIERTALNRALVAEFGPLPWLTGVAADLPHPLMA